MAVTWYMEADFDRDGTYETDLRQYIAARLGPISVDRGMGADGRYRVGTMSFAVDNKDEDFTPENLSGPFTGQLRPGVPMRLRGDNGTSYTLFTGYLHKLNNKWVVGRFGSAQFGCQDIMAYLAGYSTTNVTVAERTTSAALTAIATNIGLSGSDYSFSGGQQTLPYHWSRNQDALSAMMDVVNSEMGGTLFADGDGAIVFQGRNARLGITPDDTWGDGTDIMPVVAEYEMSDDQLISSVSIQANVFVLDDPNLVVFVASRNKDSTSFSLAAGETYEVELDYAQPITSLTTPVAQTDYQYNTASDGTGTDETANVDVAVTDLGAGFRLKLVNNSASTVYQMKFQLRGIPLNYVSDRPTFISELSIPGEKIDQSIAMLIPFADDDVQARNYSQGLLRTYRYEYPRLKLTFAWRNTDTETAMMALELGDLVKYADRAVASGPRAYVDEWWRVEGIKHHDLQAGRLPKTSVTLVPSYLYFNLDAVLFDNFERDNASGDLGTSLFGDVWANDSGFDIASNLARANTDTLSMATLDLGTGITDQVVEMNLAAIGTGDEVGGVLRYEDADNQVRFYLDKGSNELILEKNVATTVTELASPAFTVGTAHELKAMVQGDRIRVYADRVLLIDDDTGSLPTGTKVGIMARNANATTTFANFHARGLDS